MRMYDIIQKKKEGKTLTKEEIYYFIEGYVKGDIPDYQISALLMAIFYKGMDLEESTNLTLAIRDSGKKWDFSSIEGIRVDKHSTGGVGDKTSLVVAPIVAAIGVKVAKMSGRGLGHTGGTIDKLESIPGFKVELKNEDFINQVNKIGIAIIGQSNDIAPADKKLYALRDVTATIDSIPLIASSIMGKKLAADDDCIVLDVKTGSGAFMKTVKESKQLATVMVEIGKRAGKKMLAILTDMAKPLGRAIGNSLEVIEAIETLKGNGPKDFTDLCVMLSTNILYLASYGTKEECEKMVIKSIQDGSALYKLKQMIKAQGGNENCVDDYSIFGQAKFQYEVKAKTSGYINSVNAEGYGMASLLLGAGRNVKEDPIDYLAGVIINKKNGDYVNEGDVIATLYASDEAKFKKSEEKIIESTIILGKKPKDEPLVIDMVE